MNCQLNISLYSEHTNVHTLHRFLDEDLADFCKENDWKIDGEFISIRNQEAHVKSKNISEKITFESKHYFTFFSLVISTHFWSYFQSLQQ